MIQALNPYADTVLVAGAVAALLLVQLLVVDVLGILRRHVPGTPVPPDHDDPLFRATRAHANTNESIAVFVLLLLFGPWRGADPDWLALGAWLYLAGRVGHALCYYADWRTARSVAFGLGVLGLLTMLLAGVLA